MRALVLVSGGIDSTVALWWARAQGWATDAITFHYHERPPPEIEATAALSRAAGVRLVEVELPWLAELDEGQHPLLENPRLETPPEGYIPARNAIFYAIAAHHAELLGSCRIVGGHNGVDPETFPDASAEFFDHISKVLRSGLASRTEVEIVQPLHGMTKEEVLRLGLELDAPLEMSWSCYEVGPMRCGACPSCQERAAAFAAVGVEDPALARVG